MSYKIDPNTGLRVRDPNTGAFIEDTPTPSVTVQYKPQDEKSRNPIITGPDDLRNLYTNARTVGYTGLDEAQKKLFRDNFPQSKAAKNGMTLEDAIRATDIGKSDKSVYETVVTPITDTYRAIKENVTAPAVALPLSLVEAIPGFGQYKEGTTYPERVAQSQEEQMDEVKRGESNLAGFFGAPENFAPFALGKAVPLASRMLTKIPAVGGLADGLGTVKKVAIPEFVGKGVEWIDKAHDVAPYWSGLGSGALKGAFYGALAQLDRPESDAIPTPTDFVKGAGLGAIPGAASGLGGAWLREHAIENYPGMEKLSLQEMKGVKNTGLNEMSRDQRIQVYEDLAKEHTFPTRKNYYDLGNKYTSISSKEFQKADKIFDQFLEKHGYPYGGITTDDLEKAMFDAIDEDSKIGRLAGDVTTDDIQKYVADKMAGIKRLASLIPRKVSDQFISQHPEIDADELSRSIIPISFVTKNVLHNLNKDVGGLISKTPERDADMAMAAREGIIEQIIKGKGIKDIDPMHSGQLPIPSVDGAGNLTDITYRPYEEILAPKTRENYAFGMKIKKNVANQVETGPRGRIGIPFLGEVGPHIYSNLKSNYVIPALMYGLGDRLSNKFFTPGTILSSGLSRQVDHEEKSK